MANTDNILQVADLTISYDGEMALRDAAFAIPRGSATALIGANGAGKTSTLLAIAGALPRSARTAGSIDFHQAGRGGATIVPEQDKVFSLMSVEDNLRLVARRNGSGRVRLDDIFDWFPRLAERRRSLAGNLSGGEQQMVALSLGLLCSPELLLIDEPTLGLAVPVIEALCEKLTQLRKELDMTVLLAEADANWIASLAERAIVLDRGAIVATIEDDLAEHRSRIHELTLGLALQEAAQ